MCHVSLAMYQAIDFTVDPTWCGSLRLAPIIIKEKATCNYSLPSSYLFLVHSLEVSSVNGHKWFARCIAAPPRAEDVTMTAHAH